MSFFNPQGEMNAASIRDSLQNLVKFASYMENQPSNYAFQNQSQLDTTRRDELISRAIMTQEGKLALAQAMANPIN